MKNAQIRFGHYVVKNVTHVFFDFDDTIALAGERLVPLWKRVLSEFNGAISATDIEERIKGRPAKIAIREIHPDWSSGQIEKFLEKLEYCEEIEPYSPVPGVVNLIERFCSEGINLSIVTTSWKEKVDYALNRFGVKKYFNNFVTREMVDEQKPSSKPYELAFRNSGALSLENCVALEDSRTGVLSAKSAGLTCVGLFNSGLLEYGADTVIQSFEEVCING